MKVKCEYCDNFIDDTEEVCPLCGAPNEHMVRSGIGVPKTIEELRAFAESKNLPLRQMRFFLGEDIREPRAFGIYKDEGGNCIVYKNKSDGSRVIRYRGEDEAYAVNELYQKMRTEVTEQKAKRGIYPVKRSVTPPFGASSAAPVSRASAQKQKRRKIFALVLMLALAALFIAALVLPDNGYYYYQDTYYYVEDVGGSWYVYDEITETWSPCPKVREIARNWRDYKIADAAEQSSQTSVTYVDTYYSPHYDYSYSYGNDYSYSDSWDDDDSYDSWDDDWDDDDWDWDSSYDWDDSYTDWDSNW